MEQKKNQLPLSEISDKFTEDTLKKIFSTYYGEQDVKVIDWDFSTASAKGDSYLSTVNKVKVNGLANDKPLQLNLVIKSLPKNVGRRKTFRSSEFFSNEIMFYTKILPKYDAFLKDKNQSHLVCIPRHLASLMDGENDYIALQDVSVLGFGPIARQNALDINQSIIILKTMARFHGVSFAWKDQRKDEFAKSIEFLKETYFGPEHWDWYSKFHHTLIDIATNALVTVYPDSTATKRFCSYEFGALYDKCSKLCSQQDSPTSVICQGDSWAPNFLVRNTNKDTKEALILDFQLAHCVSPILDLSFFIYACTDKKLRDEHFDNMLKIYYNELRKTIDLLGSNGDKLYSWDTFMKEVNEKFFYGLVFALEAVPFTILDESQAFDLDTLIKGDEAENISNVWQLSNIPSLENRKRLADVVVHAVENGYL